MKHRIWNIWLSTGLWAWWNWELDNSWVIHPIFLWKVYYGLWINKLHQKCDYKVTEDYIEIWTEASYQMDETRIIRISKNIQESFILTGIAWWFYWSDVAKKIRRYRQFKYNCKTKRLIESLHKHFF